MDPEILKELNESLRELNDTLKKQSSDLVNHSLALSKASQATNDNTNAVNNTNKANSNVAQGLTKYGQSVSEVDKKLQEQNIKFGIALKATGAAALDFGRALTSADTSLTKYGSSATQLGGQAWEIGKNFGIAGKVIGGILSGLGLAANSILTLNQNIIDFRDGFAKQAGILPVTADQLGTLASEAGFAYNRMPKLAKTVQNLGPSLLSLGGYAGEGAVRFMNIANVGEETRKRFSRMGLQQEDLLEYQSYYIELQRSSGNAAANRRKTDQQIQRESLVYAEHLLELSALTGEKASTIQDREKQVTENIQEQARIAAEEVKIKELEQLDTPEADAEIAKIREERRIRQTFMRRMAVERGVKAGEEAGSIRALGGYTADMQGAVLNDIAGIARNIEGVEDVEGAVARINRNSLDNLNRIGVAGEHDKALIEQFANLSTGEDLNRVLRLQETDVERLRAAQAAKGQAGDPLADTAASLQELEIAASQKFQAFLETIDPFRNGLELFKNAALIAAAAIGGGALIAGLAKVIGGRFGELGSPTNPMHVKMSSGPNAPAAGTGIGSRLKSIFSRSATPAAAAVGATPAAATGPLSRAATGATALSGAAGSASGSKVGMFLIGLSNGLKAFSNPKILIGATVLSGSIAIIGAGIAGATWIIGKSLPSLATGLKSFNKIDGDRLQKIGTGMAGMAVGLLAIGSSKISDAMGHLAAWMSGDKSNPIDNLQTELTKFQNLDIDPNKVERNSKAFIAFNKMVAEATDISGTVAGMLARAFSSFFEVEIPLDKFKEFSDLDINAEQAGKNATAFKLFAEAMNSYKGFGTINALGVISKSLGGSVDSFYKALPTDEPIARFEKFSKIKINGEQAKINAGAFKDFANALAEYKGGPGVMEALSQLAGGALMSLFGVDGPVDAFRKFAQEDFGPNMERNTQALTNYANSTTGNTTPPQSGGSSGMAATSGGTGGTSSAGEETSGATTSTSTTAGETPTTTNESTTATISTPSIGAGKDTILNYAQSLNASDRAAFYRSLATQGMQKAAAARAAGNSSQATLWERAANQYQLATEMAESQIQTGENNNTTTTTSESPNIVSIGRDLQQRGLKVAEHPAFGGVSPVHRGRGHYEGRAIDINAVAGRDADNPRAAAILDNLKTELQRKGLTALWRTTGHYGHMHAEVPKPTSGQLRAEAGGVFSNSPTMLPDGRSEAQKVGILNPQSLISKLGKITVEQTAEVSNTVPSETETDLTPELLHMIEGKLEKVLYALENNHYTHEKILKNSM